MRRRGNLVLGVVVLVASGLLFAGTLWNAFWSGWIMEVQIPLMLSYGALALIGFNMCKTSLRRH